MCATEPEERPENARVRFGLGALCDSAQPPGGGSTDRAQQQGLGLVIEGVAGDDELETVSGPQPFEGRVAQHARARLRRASIRHPRIDLCSQERNPETGRTLAHQFEIEVGAFAAQAVMHMCRRNALPESRQGMQHRDRVASARHR